MVMFFFIDRISTGHIVRTSQMFTHVWRGRIHPTTKDLAKACQRMMSSVYFKLRKLKPCLIGNLQLKVDIDEENDCFLRLYGKHTYFLLRKST